MEALFQKATSSLTNWAYTSLNFLLVLFVELVMDASMLLRCVAARWNLDANSNVELKGVVFQTSCNRSLVHWHLISKVRFIVIWPTENVLLKEICSLCATTGKPNECSSIATSTSTEWTRLIDHCWSPQAPLHRPLFPRRNWYHHGLMCGSHP